MRSYEAARSYFSFLGFLSWCIIILGGFVAVGAIVAISEMSRSYGGSPMAGLAGLVPGVGIMFAGFMGLVVVQIGRAGVDSAEYAQQSLQIAREQLEISRQSQRSGIQGADGFAAVSKEAEATEQTGPSFSDVNVSKQVQIDLPPEARMEDASEKNTDPSTPVSARVALGLEDGVLEYGGKSIEVRGGKFLVAEMAFTRLAGAQDYIDHTSADTSPELSGVRRS